MFQYTKATLKSALQDWNTSSNAEFVAALDEIIQRGELRLARLLDLDNLDSVLTTTTSDTVPEVWKPENLVTERVMVMSVTGVKRFLHKRSRAFIEAVNIADAEGPPVYYGEYDEQRWFVAPIPDGDYLIYVHGVYRPASIVDGSDGSTTWFSTRVPDLLFLACSIEANEYLKFWAHKAANEAELASKLDDFRGIAANLTRADVEDLVGARQASNQPTTPPQPEST